MSRERWKIIQDFESYEISDMGNVRVFDTGVVMRCSHSNFGHKKITMVSDWDRKRYTRSVALLVAKAFLEPPDILCNRVLMLNGVHTDARVANLAWRPQWFVWKYTHQLNCQIPVYYQNLPVLDVVEDCQYDNIVQAGMTEGLLFEDIWRSTYTKAETYPTGSVFEIFE